MKNIDIQFMFSDRGITTDSNIDAYDMNSAWSTTVTGTYTQLKATSGNYDTYLKLSNYIWEDCEAEWTFRGGGTVKWSFALFNANNNTLIGYMEYGNSVYSISTEGVEYTFGSRSSKATTALSTGKKVKVRIEGTTITLWIGSTQILTRTYSALKVPKYWSWKGYNDGRYQRYSDFTIKSL